MGDRCYMQLTCRTKDREVFEELGFHVETEWEDKDFPNCVEMVDYEANFAHTEDLPKDVVYSALTARAKDMAQSSSLATVRPTLNKPATMTATAMSSGLMTKAIPIQAISKK